VTLNFFVLALSILKENILFKIFMMKLQAFSEEVHCDSNNRQIIFNNASAAGFDNTRKMAFRKLRKMQIRGPGRQITKKAR
jgi:hypothetical protein